MKDKELCNRFTKMAERVKGLAVILYDKGLDSNDIYNWYLDTASLLEDFKVLISDTKARIYFKNFL